VDTAFRGSVSRIGGLTLDEVPNTVKSRVYFFDMF